MATKKRTTAKVARPKAAKKTRPKQTTKAATKSPKRATKATSGKPAAKPKLSQMAAAVKVLKQSRKPLTCTQMVEAMAKKKLWTSPGGKTPEQTLYASILRDIQKHGDDSQFQEVDRDLFDPGFETVATAKIGVTCRTASSPKCRFSWYAALIHL